MIRHLSVALFFFATQSYGAQLATVTLSYETVGYCGQNYIRFSARSTDANVDVLSAEVFVPGSDYIVPIPAKIELSNTATVERGDVAFSLSSLPAGLAPLPKMPIYKMGEYVKKECAFLAGYQAALKKISTFELSSPLLKLNVQNGKLLSTQLKTTFLSASKDHSDDQWMQEARTKASASVNTAAARTMQISQPEYVIIAQDAYVNEANELAQYRISQGYASQVTLLSQIPGYYPEDVTPAECTGAYVYECYITSANLGTMAPDLRMYAGLQGVNGPRSGMAVSSVLPARLTLVRGVIRAYLRALKKQSPALKYVLLIGDPEKIPPSFAATVTEQALILYMPTDYFYTQVSSALGYYTNCTATNASAYFGKYSLIKSQVLDGRYVCVSSAGVSRYRSYCEPGETYNSSITSKEGAFFPVGIAGCSSLMMASGLSASPVGVAQLVVGRVFTHSERHQGHDINVASYIQKLKYWETALPPFEGENLMVSGGYRHWVNSAGVAKMRLVFGNTLKVHAPARIVPNYSPNSAFTNMCLTPAANCISSNPGIVMADLSSKSRAGLYFMGHGGKPSIEAPEPLGNPVWNPLLFTTSNYFHADEHYTFGAPAALINSNNSPQTFKFTSLPAGKLIGHVVANSCDPANFDSFGSREHEVLRKYSTANQVSLAEELINLPMKGAINVIMNYSVGWSISGDMSGADDGYNLLIAKKMRLAWQSCGRSGDAYLGVLKTSYDFYQRYNRFFEGDPLAYIAAPHPSCPQLPASDPLAVQL